MATTYLVRLDDLPGLGLPGDLVPANLSAGVPTYVVCLHGGDYRRVTLTGADHRAVTLDGGDHRAVVLTARRQSDEC